MITIKCKTQDTVKLDECVPFQGNLKRRTTQDLQALKHSLETEGLLMPFVLWVHDGKKLLLDGHARHQALMSMSDNEDGAYILARDWPCIYVEAETEDDARKALLQITSQYGKITKAGVSKFMATIPNYTAPSVSKFTAKAPKKTTAKKVEGFQVLRVRVPVDKYAQVLEIFKQVSYIEVL